MNPEKEHFKAMDRQWQQVFETVIIKDWIENIKAAPKRKFSLREKISSYWFNLKWELSNFIMERD